MMMAKKGLVLKFRRRREGVTDYRKRLALVKSGLPILTVRKTNTRVVAHIREYSPQGDITRLMISSEKLRDYGWRGSFKNLPASYLTGYLFGKLAVSNGFNKVVFDIGRYPSTKGSRLYAFLKGCVDAGLSIPHSSTNFPSEERIVGRHIGGDVEKMFKKVMDNIEKMFAEKGKDAKKDAVSKVKRVNKNKN